MDHHFVDLDMVTAFLLVSHVYGLRRSEFHRGGGANAQALP
jgi:hypothetical protein